MTALQLQNELTWPAAVTEILCANRELLDEWYGAAAIDRERNRKPGDIVVDDRSPASQHDSVVAQIDRLLRPYSIEYAYHCTRLTESEISDIQSRGMRLPDRPLLVERINRLVQERCLSASDARYLQENSQSGDPCRSKRIWFCFYPPHMAGERGIQRFFRYWGGEALYNSHQDHTCYGPLLCSIGSPCIVVALIPVSALYDLSSLSMHLARRFFANRGIGTPHRFEHYTVVELAKTNIHRIVRLGESDFTALTHCDRWQTPLS